MCFVNSINKIHCSIIVYPYYFIPHAIFINQSFDVSGGDKIQEKITDLGYTGKYTIVKRCVSSKKAEYNRQATIRFETMPGLQGQVDWAHFPDYQVYKDGRYKKLYCFLMILSFSRARYIESVTDMSTDTLLRCHNNAFRHFKRIS